VHLRRGGRFRALLYYLAGTREGRTHGALWGVGWGGGRFRPLLYYMAGTREGADTGHALPGGGGG